MEFQTFDEVVQCVREYDNAKDALEELEQQNADVVSQIAQQEAQHDAEARAERAKARQELRNIDQEFKEREAELMRKLEELRTKRDQDKARVQHGDDQLHQRFEDAVSVLRSKQQDILVDIKKSEDRIEDLRKRHSRTIVAPSQASQAPEAVENDAGIESPPDSDKPSRPLTNITSQKIQKRVGVNGELITVNSLNEDFPLVVNYKGNWHEIACFVCSTNQSRDKSRFYRGWIRLRQHIYRAHESEWSSSSDEELLKACIKRHFRQSDVDLMSGGYQPVEGGPILKFKKVRASDETESSTLGQSETVDGADEESDDSGDDYDDDDDHITTRRRSSAVSTRRHTGKDKEEDEPAASDMENKSISDIDESADGLDLDQEVGDTTGKTVVTEPSVAVALMTPARSSIPTEAQRPIANSIDRNRDPRRAHQPSSGISSATPTSQWLAMSHTGSRNTKQARSDHNPPLDFMTRAYADKKYGSSRPRDSPNTSSAKSSDSPPHKRQRQLSGEDVRDTGRRGAVSGPSSTEPSNPARRS